MDNITLAIAKSYVDDKISGVGGVKGDKGEDGFSPIANVKQTESGAIVTITDKDGSTSTIITNGEKGEKGSDGYTPQKNIDYFDGQDGKDGIGITSVEQTIASTEDGGINIVTVKKSDNTTSTFQIRNGSKGDKGDKGETGENGKDGSDASVTTENIKMALGYTPAVQEDVDKLSEKIAGLGVPNYMVAEAERVANNVQAIRNAKTFVIAAMSDFHLKDGDSAYDESLYSTRHAGMGLGELQKRMHTDLVALLGDYSWMSHDYTVEQVKKDIILVKKTLGLDTQELWSIGNHDLNYGKGRDRRLTDDELYSFIGVNSDGVKPYLNIERGYGYIDFENQKIRVINLNTCDSSDWIDTSWNTTEGSSCWCEWISPTQIKWLADTALNFTDKENVSEWGIVIIGHHPLHYGYKCFSHVMELLEAYKNGTSGSLQCGKYSDYISSDTSIEWVYETVAYDFTTGDKAEIICNIHGHNHNCGSSMISSSSWSSESTTNVEPWLWRFCIPNVCEGRYNEAATNTNTSFASRYGEFDENGNPVYWTKETETAKATSFNVISIDRKNKKIYAYIFGAGKDRVFSYEGEYVPAEYTITTSLTNCTGASNNPNTITEGLSTTLTFAVDEGYELPSDISVIGASYTWDSSTGILALNNPLSNVSITIVATEIIVEPTNYLVISERTYTPLSEPQFITATEAHEMDYTKCYATDSTGRRGSHPTNKITYTPIADTNGFMYKIAGSTSGYGVEFPVQLEGGKTYELTFTPEGYDTNVRLFKYNEDATINESTLIRSATNGLLSATIRITTEIGYLYSLVFNLATPDVDIIVNNISLMEVTE